MIALNKADKTALLFGATGLIGGYCLTFLLESKTYEKVKVFTRRKIELKHSKLEQHLIDFNKLAEYADLMTGDDVFCCLGTTRKKAGSKAAFSKVDFTYVFEIAKIVSKNKANQFLLVSSIGADPDSMFFYNQVKGRIELAIQELDFWTVHIFRPSVLLGQRTESRWGESATIRLAKVLDFFTGGLATKYRPIEAEQVAKSMVYQAQGVESGIFIHESRAIQKM